MENFFNIIKNIIKNFVKNFFNIVENFFNQKNKNPAIWRGPRVTVC